MALGKDLGKFVISTRVDFATQWHQVLLFHKVIQSKWPLQTETILSTRNQKQTMPKLPENRKKNCCLVQAKASFKRSYEFLTKQGG